MALQFAPPSATISHLLADWLELAAFASATGRVPVDEVNEALEIEEDHEPEEIHAEDDLREARVQATVSSIEERRRVMEGSYPFRLSDDGRLLSLNPEWTNAGRSAYLLCLLLSHSSGEGFLSESPLPRLEPARDLFQACATLCAAGFCGGPAFSFGWPRPDKTGFHQKLLEVFRHFGDGVPHPAPPPGSPQKIKDGGIDVIAWSHEPDGKPGTVYLLGQAASGQDWKDKSILQFLNLFHDFWFEHIPASKPTAAIFIPFCLPESDHEVRDHIDQEEIDRGHLRYLTHLLGLMFYRYRIPRHADRALSLAEDGIGPIERLNSVRHVVGWVEEARRLLVEVR